MKLTKAEEEAYHSFVHTPTQANAAFVAMSRSIAGSRGISTGSKVLDHYVIPTRPGWVRYWLARPGEGKTTMLRTIAMTEARRLAMEKRTDTHYVAHITWEESVDGQELYYQMGRSYKAEDFWRGKVPMDIIKKDSAKRPSIPIYMLGQSMHRSHIDSKPMTVGRAIDGLRAVYKIEGKVPSLIVADYAQEIEVEMRAGTKRTEQVIQGTRDLIAMAINLKCPIELGVQAKQDSLKTKPYPIPNQESIEWAFFIHQKVTNGISLWRPWVTHKDKGPKFTIDDVEYNVSPNIMVAKPLKHRPGLLRKILPFELNPDGLIIKDIMRIP